MCVCVFSLPLCLSQRPSHSSLSAPPHPGPIVEAASLAAVPAPVVTYQPLILTAARKERQGGGEGGDADPRDENVHEGTCEDGTMQERSGDGDAATPSIADSSPPCGLSEMQLETVMIACQVGGREGGQVWREGNNGGKVSHTMVVMG